MDQVISAITGYYISVLCQDVGRPMALTGPYLEAIFMRHMTVFMMHSPSQFTHLPAPNLPCNTTCHYVISVA